MATQGCDQSAAQGPEWLGNSEIVAGCGGLGDFITAVMLNLDGEADQ